MHHIPEAAQHTCQPQLEAVLHCSEHEVVARQPLHPCLAAQPDRLAPEQWPLLLQAPGHVAACLPGLHLCSLLPGCAWHCANTSPHTCCKHNISTVGNSLILLQAPQPSKMWKIDFRTETATARDLCLLLRTACKAACFNHKCLGMT